MHRDVTIIIPAYNAARWVARAIDSCIAQTAGEPEVLVIDDGSTDSTGDVCRQYGQRIRYVRQDNAGVSAARNHGIRLASGQFIGFLDADDELLPNMTGDLLAGFGEFPEAGASGGAWIQREQSGERRVPRQNFVFSDGRHRGLLKDFYSVYNRARCVWTASSLFRRSTIEQVGFFREDMRLGEDLEYWMRVAGKYPWVFLDRPVSVYNRFSISSVTLQEGNHPPVEYLYDEQELVRHVRPELRPGYRVLRRDSIVQRCGWMCLRGQARKARKALRAIQAVPATRSQRLVWLLAHLPGPLSKCLARIALKAKAYRRSLQQGRSD